MGEVKKDDLVINGVPGQMYRLGLHPENGDQKLFHIQVWQSEFYPDPQYEDGRALRVVLRYDTTGGKAANTFRVGSQYDNPIHGVEAGDEAISRVFPSLVPLLRWHGMTGRGPENYIRDTLFEAGDQDIFGRKAGDPTAWQQVIYFGDSPVPHEIDLDFARFLKDRMIEAGEGVFMPNRSLRSLKIEEVMEGDPSILASDRPRYRFEGMDVDWSRCPFKSRKIAEAWQKAISTCACRFQFVPVSFARGKAQNLEAARRAAFWPDATDEDLMQEPTALAKALNERLPKLMEEFKAAIEGVGFHWEPEQPDAELAAPGMGRPA